MGTRPVRCQRTRFAGCAATRLVAPGGATAAAVGGDIASRRTGRSTPGGLRPERADPSGRARRDPPAAAALVDRAALPAPGVSGAAAIGKRIAAGHDPCVDGVLRVHVSGL